MDAATGWKFRHRPETYQPCCHVSTYTDHGLYTSIFVHCNNLSDHRALELSRRLCQLPRSRGLHFAHSGSRGAPPSTIGASFSQQDARTLGLVVVALPTPLVSESLP